MKKFVLPILLFVIIIFSGNIFAEPFDYYYLTQNYSDDLTNNIYVSIYEFETSGLISKSEKTNARIINNYLIFNTLNKSSKFLFVKNSEHISLLLFETGFDKINGRVNFNIKNSGETINTDFDFIINNNGVSERTIKNNILIITNNINDKIETIWICDKFGNNMIKLASINNTDSWHLDIKNSKIRVITQKGLNSSIKEYEW